MKLIPIGPKGGHGGMGDDGPMMPPELNITGADFEAVGMRAFKVGDMLMMTAAVRIASVSDRNDRPCASLEVKAVAFEPAVKPVDHEKILFPNDGAGPPKSPPHT